jgi:PAS domain-containing protein
VGRINLGALTYGGIRSPAAGGHILVVIIATLLFSGRLVLVFVGAQPRLARRHPRRRADRPPAGPADPRHPAGRVHRPLRHLFSAGFFLYLGVKNLQDARRAPATARPRPPSCCVEATAAKQYADNILASMAESLVVLDPRGTIITVNKATLDLLGHAAERPARQPFTVVMPDFGAHATDSEPTVGTHEPVERSYRTPPAPSSRSCSPTRACPASTARASARSASPPTSPSSSRPRPACARPSNWPRRPASPRAASSPT